MLITAIFVQIDSPENDPAIQGMHLVSHVGRSITICSCRVAKIEHTLNPGADIVEIGLAERTANLDVQVNHRTGGETLARCQVDSILGVSRPLCRGKVGAVIPPNRGVLLPHVDWGQSPADVDKRGAIAHPTEIMAL